MIVPRRLSNLSGFVLLLGIVAATVTTPTAQAQGPIGLLATRSVNMVSGTSWPNGDPYLQRQNEPSVAVSTRNTQHLLAGANDYRSVDLPGISTGPETGDAWLGVFKSFDGGERWQSTLLPGYPQDTSADGLASPLHAYQAGADAVVRAGTNGLLYFSGLAFNRGTNAASGVFMSRFIDNNNKENGDPVKYLGTTMIDKSTGADFIDKPWMAVDVPRQGAKTCRITQTDLPPAVKPLPNAGKFHKPKKDKKDPPKLKDPKPFTQSIPAGTIYVAYSRITTIGTDVTSRIMMAASDDCGASWSKPVQISNPADKVNQGATIAIDPRTGAVYVAWRQFGLTVSDTDSIVVARTLNQGKSFEATTKVHKFNAHRATDRLRKMIAEHRMGDADDVAEIQPFDQGTAEDRFRTNAYPSIAIDDEGRAYLAWTERGFGIARSSATDGDARIVVSTSKTGAAWTAPRPVDDGGSGQDMPGHQLMPSIAFAAGKLVVVYYDLREDVSQVFGPFVEEKNLQVTVHKRHTIDIRSAYALKGDVPVFGASTQVSQYMMGSRPGSTSLEQMQYNAPNLPLFKLGTVPFMGDYIDLAPSPMFVQQNGAWKYNTAAQAAPVFHVVWTDNRDVRPPRDGDWTHYTPVKVSGVPGTFDPNQPAPACVPGQTGMRNQNIYSARLTFGLVTGSPGNAKPLDASLPRGFVVFAQNTTTATKSYRLTIAAQPSGGKASFTQTSLPGQPDPLLSVDVTVAPKSMVTRTVFVTSTDSHAQVPVDVNEISAPAMPIVVGGLSSRVVLNPDISNPDISNPDISNPDISNPDISNAEVYNPDISNPDISNPDISNPDISNPDISNPDISNKVVANPDISNPDISNPDISNPDISNPDISNPDISNPDISNGALTDVTWTIVNTGNTTASFNVNLFLANAAAKLAGVKTQLIVHKTYSTPVADECTLKSQTQTVLVANVPNPTFQAPGSTTAFDPTNPAVTNTTVWLEPGGTSKITLRIIDPNPADTLVIDPVHDVTPVVTAVEQNTTDIGTVTPPPVVTPPVPDDVMLNFALAAQPSTSILTQTMAPVVAHALLNGAPAPGVQVTLAIANNPAGGHLSGTTTVLTDANGNATFTDLSIERAGLGYRLSASASAFGALPDLSSPFDITFAPVVANAAGGTFTFDGQPHAGTCGVLGFDNVPLEGAISYSSTVAPVDAGTYSITCSYPGNGYYGPATSTAPIVITPASSSTIVTCADATYTGAAQETCSAAVSGAGGLSTSVPVTYSNNVNAGTATGNASYGGDPNHSGSNGSSTFTIAPASSSTSVACSNTTYSGSPQQPCTSTVTGSGGFTSTAPVTYTNNTNAGTASAASAFPGDANHAASNGSSTFTIAPAASTADASGGNFVYDGAAHSGGCSVAGVGGEVLTGTISWSSGLAPVSPGTYIVTCTFPAGGNYLASSDTDTIVITDPYVITKVVDDGTIGTLRYAIIAANANADVNTITFAIPAPPFTISPSSPLPPITKPVVIDGLTQAGSATYAPVVVINGASAGAGAHGLVLATNGATVRGLAIQGFASGSGVFVPSGHNTNTIEDNVITNNNAGVNFVTSDTNIVRRNVLSANTFSGVIVNAGSNNTIVNNRIGTTADGTAAMGNLDNGITVFGGTINAVVDSNVISGNAHRGIDAQFGPAGAKVTGLRVINNTIGLAVDGDTAVPNRTGGIQLNQTEGAIIGEPAGRNTISGNATFDPLTCAGPVGGPGIRVLNASTVMPVIRNNYIGLSANGANARPNGFEGVTLDAKAQVGGPGANDRNFIAGNGCAPALAGAGIVISPTGSGAVVQGNTIGLSVTGAALGNGYSGVSAFATAGAQIGGPNAGEGNIITGNSIGVAIYKSGSNPAPANITIVRNQIGADVSGDLPGNSNIGVYVLDATGIVVGGAAGDANLIDGNGSHGVQVQGAGNVAVLSNSISGNGGLGIQLVGPAANGNQAAPVLSHAVDNGGATTVDFTLASDNPNTVHKVQLFVNASCDASGRGEGSRLEGTFAQTTDGSGNVSGTLTLDEESGIGAIITATVTDAQGNTSQFSNCTTVAPPAPPAVITSASPANEKSGEGFMVLRGSNLPTDIAIVQSGAGPANGFIYQAPSTAGAVWVRMPGAPTGPATIQLKNAAGTVVSNAFPITISPDPGTPVITGIYNAIGQPITAPVPTGATILVAADGIDTTGAVVRFAQGANTWDVPAVSTAAGSFGIASQVTVPATAGGGAISVSIRQGASLPSATSTITVQSSQASPLVYLAGNLLGNSNTLADFALSSPAGTYTFTFYGGPSCATATNLLTSTNIAINGTGRHVFDIGLQLPTGSVVAVTATDAASNTSAAVCTQVTQPGVAYSFATGHYYQYVLNSGLSFGSAKTAAATATFASLTGHLVSITSATEQNVVHSLYTQMGLGDMRAWIGLYDNSGSFGWSWTTGEGLSFTNWNAGEPNNMGSERAVEFFASGAWNNNSEFFTGTFGYVVEYQ